SMALLHEKLYQSKSMAGVEFSAYVRDLTRNLFQSYGVNSGASELELQVSDVTLGMDTAVPCGLIINELVSNSLKHAFPPRQPGKVSISLKPDHAPKVDAGHPPGEKWYMLTVADKGRGFPDGVDFRNTDSLGLKLVCTLTEQLFGTIDLNRNGGTEFTIRFREL
ncbi:MAG TPA: sensor histidine kinase, partial [Spirochaetia bacterium]|nr:sensor histidine kinase [Spirochaetia bacterium]